MQRRAGVTHGVERAWTTIEAIGVHGPTSGEVLATPTHAGLRSSVSMYQAGPLEPDGPRTQRYPLDGIDVGDQAMRDGGNICCVVVHMEV